MSENGKFRDAPFGWPRAMSEHVAAMYCSISTGLMRTLIKKSGFPEPVHLSEGRVVWSKEHIDKWLDGKFGVITASEETDIFRTG